MISKALKKYTKRSRRFRPRGNSKVLHIYYECRRRLTVMRSKPISSEELGANIVTLARVIGNDLYPRHAVGQGLRNLEFILENEPDYPDCRKVFVINRLFDQQSQEYAAQQIRDAGHTALIEPFSIEAYATKVGDLSWLPEDTVPLNDSDARRYFQGNILRRRLWACADKICYAMNVNGARNVALDEGRANSLWTLVLDGGCFVPPTAYAQLRSDLFTGPITPYVIIPMTRLTANATALWKNPEVSRAEEPQLAFHRDSLERFDERLPYGLRDKESLLKRLRVPGPWHVKDDLDVPGGDDHCSERFCYKFARAGVFRLSSGIEDGQLEAPGAQLKRYRARNKAIFLTLRDLDRRSNTLNPLFHETAASKVDEG